MWLVGKHGTVFGLPSPVIDLGLVVVCAAEEDAASQSQQAHLEDVPPEVDIEADGGGEAGDAAQDRALGPCAAGEPAVAAKNAGETLGGDVGDPQLAQLLQHYEVADEGVGVLDGVGEGHTEQKARPDVAQTAAHQDKHGQ